VQGCGDNYKEGDGDAQFLFYQRVEKASSDGGVMNETRRPEDPFRSARSVRVTKTTTCQGDGERKVEVTVRESEEPRCPLGMSLALDLALYRLVLSKKPSQPACALVDPASRGEERI
jgi:hypothetical protein